MPYHFYLDKMLLPVAPSKVRLKINNQNKTMNLINEGEINILKQPGLTDVDFDVLIPQVKYPFALYKDGFQPAKTYLAKLEELKLSKEPFQLIITRTFPNGSMLFDTNMKVSLEEYTITEDSKSAYDLMVNIKLKQYKEYGTKTCNVTFANEKAKVSTTQKRENSTSPAPKKSAKSHPVVKGDCLYNIAKTYYDNGLRYTDIYKANQSIIDGKNKGTGNSKYTIYPKQVLTIPI